MESSSLTTLSLNDPRVLIVAPGTTPSAQATARGHLFERFVAHLFEKLGCITPTTEQLNVRADGFEIDLSTQLKLTKESVLAECKAYSSPLASHELNAFYGKLSTKRLAAPTVHGYFVAIPRLTSEGDTLAKTISVSDSRFHYYNSVKVYEIVIANKIIEKIDKMGSHLSDHGILIAPSGLYSIAKELDIASRLPIAILAFRPGGANKEEMELFKATDYVAGLPLIVMGNQPQVSTGEIKAESPTLVSVVGSSGDFEYQFPAAPKFFVGRTSILDQTTKQLKSNGKGSVLVLNAQSGWGKSSLALKIASVAVKQGGSASVFDVRTANGVQYVAASLQLALSRAEKIGILKLPDDASFGSLQSAVATLQNARWRSTDKPLVIFYDQFENTFRDEKLTQEFRDLALLIRDVPGPITIGFSWKTDMVALTENYPYRLRDQIRDAATVVNVKPFVAKEVGVLLGRLSREASTKLSPDLRDRIREYSQGLPWLLKKLASHILSELRAGTTEEALLEESLNVEGLFAKDLAPLQLAESDALKLIAREAPVAVADIVERVEPGVIQSLVDQRLLVRVGEKLDTYWDTFRDFLVTGKVAIEDTFILRVTPRSTSKLLVAVVDSGTLTTVEAATKLNTSLHVVFNLARDLRQVGILSQRSGNLSLVDSLKGLALADAHIQGRVAKILRRHRVFKTIQELLDQADLKRVSIEELAIALPGAYTAIEASPKTWGLYAIAFVQWLEYAGLIALKGQMISKPTGIPSTARLLGAAAAIGRKTFPQSRPELSLAFLNALIAGKTTKMTHSAEQKARSDLMLVGILNPDGSLGNLARAKAMVDPSTKAGVLRETIRNTPGGAQALDALLENPSADTLKIGLHLRDAYGYQWAESTTKHAGSNFRAWAEEAGVPVAGLRRRSRRPESP